MRTFARLAVVGLVFVVAAALGAPAHAGGCPPCQSNADCPGGFCVIHDAPVGCGDELQLCCPSQGCGIDMSGRPSCEAAGTCMVVENGGCGCRIAGASATGEADGAGTHVYAGALALLPLAAALALRRRRIAAPKRSV
jgi:hypothetical protein